MKTALHRKLESMCKISTAHGQHWMLTGAATVWVPSLGKILTTKKAIYAAFREEVPPDVDVICICDKKGCVAPYHQKLMPTRTKAASVSLTSDLEALSKRGYEPTAPDAIFPKNVTAHQVVLVKNMFKTGKAELKAMCAASKLPTHIVVKILNGRFDRALANKEKAVKALKAKRLQNVEETPAPLTPERQIMLPAQFEVKDFSMATDEALQAMEDYTPSPQIPDTATEEEREWLQSLMSSK